MCDTLYVDAKVHKKNELPKEISRKMFEGWFTFLNVPAFVY